MARINSHLSAVRRQRLPVGRQGFGDDADNFLSLRSFHFSLFSTHYTCLWQAGIISKRILDSMDKDKFTG
jgi:hypothetical protein